VRGRKSRRVSARARKHLETRETAPPHAFERLKLAPSLLFAGAAWTSALDSLPHLHPGLSGRYEFRYPYLDRDLVEFLLAIPRDQLVRPGRRRYLMRAAMKGIVPDEILERPRKASVQRGPVVALRRERQFHEELLRNSRVAEMGLIDRDLTRMAFEQVCNTKETGEWPALLRLFQLEIWLERLHGKR
jgi:asparagine synthase (glutamine-hydrolysing)